MTFSLLKKLLPLVVMLIENINHVKFADNSVFSRLGSKTNVSLKTSFD